MRNESGTIEPAERKLGIVSSAPLYLSDEQLVAEAMQRPDVDGAAVVRLPMRDEQEVKAACALLGLSYAEVAEPRRVEHLSTLRQEDGYLVSLTHYDDGTCEVTELYDPLNHPPRSESSVPPYEPLHGDAA